MQELIDKLLKDKKLVIRNPESLSSDSYTQLTVPTKMKV